jgi:hypothetical protein
MSGLMAGTGGFLQGFNRTFFPQLQANRQMAMEQEREARFREMQQAALDMQQEQMRQSQAARAQAQSQARGDARYLAGMMGPGMMGIDPYMNSVGGASNREVTRANQYAPSVDAIKTSFDMQAKIADANNPLKDLPADVKAFVLTNGRMPTWAELLDSKRAGTSQTNVTVGGGRIGTPPPGFAVYENTDGTFRMEPVPGGPVAREDDEKNRKKGELETVQNRYRDVVVDDITRVLDLVESSWQPITGPGSYLSRIAGTDSHNARTLLDSIRSSVGLERLQAIRDASPTGGALGQVSDFENRMLQAALGSLEQSQSKGQFVYNLNRALNIYLDIIHGPGNRPEQAAKPSGPVPPPGFTSVGM